jgi:hypothetical protein
MKAKQSHPMHFTRTNLKSWSHPAIRVGGNTMALESIHFRSTDILRVPGKMELTIVRDMNDYPATARCSGCGEVMPVRQKWINSSAQNLAWFAEQFRLHVERHHPG